MIGDKFYPVFVVVAAFGLFALTACGDAVVTDDEQTEGAGVGGPCGFRLSDRIQQRVENEEPLTIRVSYHDPSLPFATPVKQGVEQAANDFDVDAELVGPTGGSADAQVNEIETLIQQGIDGLAISAASNDALAPVVDRAIKEGIPTLSFNTNNEESCQMGFVGQDLVESGEVEAQELLQLLGDEEGKIVVFSVDSGAGWSHDRFTGFQQGMEGKEGIDVVGPINTGNEPQQAFNAVQNAMRRHQDAIAIASLDCCSFVAAQQWVEQNNMQDEIIVVGHDVLPDTVEALKSGIADLTLSQNPFQQGYDSVRVLVELLREGKEVTEHVNTGIVVVTEENVDEVPVEG